jgi:hypothetical protein
MRVSSNGVGSEVECTECDPPRRFKSKSGLNGHTQFKHGRLPDNRAVVPNGKQSQMYEDLTDLVEQGFDEVRYRLDSLANVNGNGQVNGNGNGQGNVNGNGQGNGNGNGQGNGNGLSMEPIGVVQPPPEEPDAHFCIDCKTDGKTIGLTPGQPYCPGCGDEIDWRGVKLPLDLDKSGL